MISSTVSCKHWRAYLTFIWAVRQGWGGGVKLLHQAPDFIFLSSAVRRKLYGRQDHVHVEEAWFGLICQFLSSREDFSHTFPGIVSLCRLFLLHRVQFGGIDRTVWSLRFV